MSKYRQDKTLKEQEQITENLNTANNVALTLYDIYSKEALENYLGFWRQPKEEEYDEEVEEVDSDQASEKSDESDWESNDDDESEDDSSDSESSEQPKKKTKKKTGKKVAKKTGKGAKISKKAAEHAGKNDGSEWASSSDEETTEPEKVKKLLLKKLEKQKNELMAQLGHSLPETSANALGDAFKELSKNGGPVSKDGNVECKQQ